MLCQLQLPLALNLQLSQLLEQLLKKSNDELSVHEYSKGRYSNFSVTNIIFFQAMKKKGFVVKKKKIMRKHSFNLKYL